MTDKAEGALSMRSRIKAVDYLKCLACLLILNSHIAKLYPAALQKLSWGGYFGNCIFFLVSGFCLTSVKDSFCKWYWKRFLRVYVPYIIAVPFLFADNRFSGQGIVDIIMPFKMYHFIPTILILYIGYYFAIWIDEKRIKLQYQALVLMAISLLYFYTLYDIENGYIYEHFSLLEMLSYFITMLLGASAKKYGMLDKIHGLIIAVTCFALYLFQSFFSFPKSLAIFQLIIGIGFAYGISCLLIGLENKLSKYSIITLISSVTLEAYIVHYICRDAYKVIGFPTNILYFLISTISVAFCLHKVSDQIIKRIPK